MLAKEVKEKQELVSALSKEKHVLTRKLRLLLKEIKQKRHKIKATIQAQSEAQTEAFLMNATNEPQETTSKTPNSTPSNISQLEEEKISSKNIAVSPIKPSRNMPITSSSSQEILKETSAKKTPKLTYSKQPETAEISKENLQIGQVFDQYEQRVAVLQKDREIYEKQYQKLAGKVGSLKSQLDEALQETEKCIVEIKRIYIR